jgi:Carboxypeptidase regulatory-like domain
MRYVSSVVAILLLAMLPIANAQTVTGQITGTVVDSAGAVIAGATVQITNEVTKQVREFTTSSNGSFIFADLVPAEYNLRTTHPGFKTYIQNRITVGTLEKLDVHNLRLEVGDASTSIEVQAAAARVSTNPDLGGSVR